MRPRTPAQRRALWAREYGFDLTYRPESYGDYADPISAILANVRGEQRRRDAREILLTGETGANEDPDHDHETRRRLLVADREDLAAKIGPRYLGGENLPPLLETEVAIARIAYRTPTWHVVELRARPSASGYAYRFVEDGGWLSGPVVERSDRPLALGELLGLIERTPGLNGERGLVIPVLESVFPEDEKPRRFTSTYVSSGDRSARVDAIRAFVTVSSGFYPELEGIYRAKMDEWMLERGYMRHAPAPGSYRRPEPLPEPVWATHPRSLREAVDRRLRAWWFRRGGPHREEEGIALGRKALELRSFLLDQAEKHGRLPVGLVTLLDQRGLEKRRVDLADLTETGELMEMVLRHGEQLTGNDIAWLPGLEDRLAAYRLDGWVYLFHADGFDGPLAEDGLGDFLIDHLHDVGELLAKLEWDSGGPGAGAGEVLAFCAFGVVWVIDDMGVSSPYESLSEAAEAHPLYWINGATTRIWDAQHGLIFERGVLYRPEVVDRYGSVCVEVELPESSEPLTTENERA